MGPMILASSGEEVVVGMTFGAVVISVVAIAMNTLRSIRINRDREQTKREIAAYVAEGSMSPEQGERLLSAGSRVDQAK